MIKRVLSTRQSEDFDLLANLRIDYLAAARREVFTPPEQLAAGIETGLFTCVLIGQPVVGYACLHQGVWGTPPLRVIWLDEIWISPQAASGSQLFTDFIQWLGRYSEAAAIPQVLFFAWAPHEALPFTEHAGAKPVVMVMRMESPTWQGEAVVPVSPPAGQSMALRCAFCGFKTPRRNALTMHLKHKHKGVEHEETEATAPTAAHN